MLQKIAAPVLCCALALSLAGCHFNTPAVVSTVGDTQISAGLYLLYQLQAYSGAQALQEDTKKNLLKDTIGEKSGEQWVLDETQRFVTRYVAIEQQFAADGLALTDEELASAQQSAKSSYAASEALYAKNGVGEQSFVTYYVNEMKYDKMVTDYNDKNAASVTDTEAKAYMDAQYHRVATLMLPIVDDDGAQLSEETLAKVQAIADKLEKDLATGDIETLAPDALKQATELCGIPYSDDLVSQYQYTTFIQEDSDLFDDETIAAILAAKVGGVGQTKAADMPIVYKKLANYKDDDEFKTSYRDAIVSNICLERFDETLDEVRNALAVTNDTAAMKTYSPKKIHLS